jgi:hypothetical protein
LNYAGFREGECPDLVSDFERQAWEKVKILRSLRSIRLITRGLDIGPVKASLLVVENKLAKIGHLSVSTYNTRTW